jgi:hypothetical protein
MIEELPGGGTSQISGASQAAAVTLDSTRSAAPQPAAARLYESEAGSAAQQQASAGKEAALQPETETGEQPEAAEGGQAQDDKSPGDQAEPPQGAPEHYEFKPVEGVQFSDEVIGKFSEVAKELNLSQDAAQKMLDQVAPAIARQQYAAIQQLNEQWVSAVKADKEIGGEKLEANLAIAKKARDAFGNDGLRKLLNDSRIGNHPEMIRFFVRAGQAISEDSFVSGGTRPSSGGKDAASVLYGKQH